MSTEFNASISVTELLTKTLENCAKELAERCIREASKRHGFDADEEIRLLGLENLSVIRKQMVKKPVAKQEENDKDKVSNVKANNKSNKRPFPVLVMKNNKSFPLPFIKETVNQDGCQGLAYNRGLFTQCLKDRMENGSYCKDCQTEAAFNASGCPDCGTVEQRLAADLYAFKDPKGRSPVSYVKVINNLKYSADFVAKEAGELNIIIPNEHFDIIKKVKKASADASARGRPKKIRVIEADNVTDLFAKLTLDDDLLEITEDCQDKDNEQERTSTPILIDEDDEENKNKSVKKLKTKLSDEEKAIKKAQLEEERAKKKAERELLIATEKAEKEAKRLAEQAEKEAQKELKRLAEQAERELKIATEKAKKEAEKEAEKAKKEAEKEAEKAKKEAKRLAEEAKKLEKAKKEAEKEAEKAKKEAEKEAKRLAEEAKKLEKAKKEDNKETKLSDEHKNTVKTTDKPPVVKPDDKSKVSEETTDEPPAKVTVTRIQIRGIEYYMSSVNILYDPKTREEVGIWDPETKTIKDLPDDEEEEEEDEYDTDNE